MIRKFYLFTISLLLFAGQTFAQGSGWKFHQGDQHQWANAGFDDSSWQTVDPGQDIQGFSQLRNAGTGWLRLHVRGAANKDLSVIITQYTASEIFLNGRLVLNYGVVSTNPDKVIAYLPSPQPVDLRLLPDKDNVIAVRLAYEPGRPYISNFYGALPAFHLQFQNRTEALKDYIAGQNKLTWFIIFYTFSGAILLIISFIHLVYFLFDRRQKINLCYFLFCLMLSFNALPNEIWGIARYGPVRAEMWIIFADGAVIVPGMLFLLMTIYTLFAYPRRLIFRLLVAAGVGFITCQYFSGTLGYILTSSVFPVLALAEGVFVCIWGMNRQKKDAAIILAGVSLFVALNIISSLFDQNSILAQVIFELSLISFPIGMSFYLGLQQAKNNRTLQRMLTEVQDLSAQNLALVTGQNERLEQQVAERTAELRKSQSQLIQSEKMASLGELTAGIAHEIQNPLNFVNNFSEVTAELADELGAEIDRGDTAEAKAILSDIQQNLEKITHHGKRADSIVKGMLEHSGVSTGQKEPADLNKLAAEYLQLAYQGLRAKDQAFQAALTTHFDSLPLINLIPRDIGRVLINLYNNAFYAVRGTTAPAIEVTTQLRDGCAWLTVKDNGPGVPDLIKDKIMQPFFTTKPTGQGTGLGLSLSYDIIVKGHGGTLTLETDATTGAAFTISLPQ